MIYDEPTLFSLDSIIKFHRFHSGKTPYTHFRLTKIFNRIYVGDHKNHDNVKKRKHFIHQAYEIYRAMKNHLKLNPYDELHLKKNFMNI